MNTGKVTCPITQRQKKQRESEEITLWSQPLPVFSLGNNLIFKTLRQLHTSIQSSTKFHNLFELNYNLCHLSSDFFFFFLSTKIKMGERSRKQTCNRHRSRSRTRGVRLGRAGPVQFLIQCAPPPGQYMLSCAGGVG